MHNLHQALNTPLIEQQGRHLYQRFLGTGWVTFNLFGYIESYLGCSPLY